MGSTDVLEELGHKRDLVVIGASAGGVETLRRVVAGLPEDLPAAVCIVLHIAPGSPARWPGSSSEPVRYRAALPPTTSRCGRVRSSWHPRTITS